MGREPSLPRNTAGDLHVEPISTLRVDDKTSLSYLDKGEGQPVVFVHGALEDYRAWSAQVDSVSREYRVITYSRRCSYPNENQGEVQLLDTVENNMEDLIALIEKLAIAPVHLVGHSYGGNIVAYLAFKRPELVRSLVLVEPGIITLYIQDPSSPLQLLLLFLRHPSFALASLGFVMAGQRALDAFQQGDPEKAARIFVDEIQARPSAFELLPDYARKMMVENARTLFDLRVTLPRFSRADARTILTPTIIVKGETSNKTSHAIAGALRECMPNSELTTVPNAGHFSYIERPEEFNETVLGFLKNRK
jgi:pimeloyl-ACP methyl ester carboxylesterase